MTYTPPVTGIPHPYISTLHAWALGSDAALRGNYTFGTPTLTSANNAVYVSLRVPFPIVVTHLWWCSSNNTGNASAALYTGAGSQLETTGSQAKLTNTLQEFALGTSRAIGPGLYYLGVSCSSGAGTFDGITFGAVTTFHPHLLGCLQEGTAHPLPATMTGATWTLLGVPFFGIRATPA